ncbi:hypothetical protein C7G41_35020 [Bradyrhizobium sp. MOS002]|nr:hypothetical protein C7G41_35020 [Bradyrhizobium sp. MOS002]
MFIVARRAVLDQRTGVLQAEIEQKDRAASMVSSLDRVFGRGFRKWDNVMHLENTHSIEKRGNVLRPV